MANAQIALPVFRVSDGRRGATGELAGLAESAAAAAKRKLASLSVSDESLSAAIQAIALTATRMQQAVPDEAPFALGSFEVSLGITASGSVGILGNGVDLECEAAFTLIFERAPKT